MNSYFDEYTNLDKDMAKLVRDIVAERERQGISQGRLSEMTGIKQSAISRIESLRALPQLDTLLRLMRPLNLKLAVVQKIGEENDIMNIKLSGIKGLDAEVLSCGLTITRSEDEYASFVTDEQDEFTTEEKDGVMLLRQKKRLFAHMFEKPVEAELRLPAGCTRAVVKNENGSVAIIDIEFAQLDTETDNGSIKLFKVRGGDLKLSSDNGKVAAEEIAADNISVKTDNGAVSMKKSAVKADIVCETDNGKITLTETAAKNIGLKSDNGSLVLEKVKVDNLELSSKNGRITADLDNAEDEFSVEVSVKSGSAWVGGKKYSGSYIYKDKDRAKRLCAKTRNGNIIITFSDTAEKISSQDEELEEEDGFVFNFSDFGDAMKNGMKSFKAAIKKQFIKTDDGYTILTPDGKEKVIVINKNNKRTVIVDDDTAEDDFKGEIRKEKVVVIDENGKRTVYGADADIADEDDEEIVVGKGKEKVIVINKNKNRKGFAFNVSDEDDENDENDD